MDNNLIKNQLLNWGITPSDENIELVSNLVKEKEIFIEDAITYLFPEQIQAVIESRKVDPETFLTPEDCQKASERAKDRAALIKAVEAVYIQAHLQDPNLRASPQIEQLISQLTSHCQPTIKKIPDDAILDMGKLLQMGGIRHQFLSLPSTPNNFLPESTS